MNRIISVVIPLFNRQKFVAATLRSLAPEHHKEVELQIIVVDDGSTDDGANMIRNQFPHVLVVSNRVNKGASACRNQGLAIASGDFVFFIDSDDLVEPGFFDNKLRLLFENQEVIGVYGPWCHFESEGEFRNQDIRPRRGQYPIYSADSNALILENLLSGWFIPINATLWRIQYIHKVGGFSEKLKINQDVDLYFRLLQQGHVIGVYSPRALIRIHSGDRVGHKISEEKLWQIMKVREFFFETLVGNGLDTTNNRKALALYGFNMWAMYRKAYPTVARSFLQFSNSIYPRLQLKGGVLLRGLARLVGNSNAVILKQLIRSSIRSQEF